VALDVLKLIASLASIAFLVGGCGAPPAVSSSVAVTDLPTWCTRGPCLGVPADPARSGVLRASGGCVWIEIDGVRAVPRWPRGYRATDQPFTAFDPAGRQVARADETIETIMLGPVTIPETTCGLTRQVDLYFDEYAADSPATS
jgi:hypothetical protein